MFQWSNERIECLVSISLDVLRLHYPVIATRAATSLHDVIKLKVRIQVLLKSLVADEPHAADGALEFNRLIKLVLR